MLSLCIKLILLLAAFGSPIIKKKQQQQYGAGRKHALRSEQFFKMTQVYKNNNKNGSNENMHTHKHI